MVLWLVWPRYDCTQVATQDPAQAVHSCYVRELCSLQLTRGHPLYPILLRRRSMLYTSQHHSCGMWRLHLTCMRVALSHTTGIHA
jgi:hypothetical protein